VLFKEAGCPEIGNVLTIRIQPDEGIDLRVIAKKPGTSLSLDTVSMQFSYKHTFGSYIVSAYERCFWILWQETRCCLNRWMS